MMFWRGAACLAVGAVAVFSATNMPTAYGAPLTGCLKEGECFQLKTEQDGTFDGKICLEGGELKYYAKDSEEASKLEWTDENCTAFKFPGKADIIVKTAKDGKKQNFSSDAEVSAVVLPAGNAVTTPNDDAATNSESGGLGTLGWAAIIGGVVVAIVGPLMLGAGLLMKRKNEKAKRAGERSDFDEIDVSQAGSAATVAKFQNKNSASRLRATNATAVPETTSAEPAPSSTPDEPAAPAVEADSPPSKPEEKVADETPKQ
eukprot:GHVT01098285.1.p1 GENE.GHVT01098285.1~~GHVT01098285.1.p1  ORF type:complete len:260 (+),score=43.94 GHVT01098285.1:197-976(+)